LAAGSDLADGSATLVQDQGGHELRLVSACGLVAELRHQAVDLLGLGEDAAVFFLARETSGVEARRSGGRRRKGDDRGGTARLGTGARGFRAWVRAAQMGSGSDVGGRAFQGVMRRGMK